MVIGGSVNTKITALSGRDPITVVGDVGGDFWEIRPDKIDSREEINAIL